MMNHTDDLIVQEQDLILLITAYLEAFDARDLSTCVDFYAEDATIDFALGTYQGKAAIQEWHEDRFEADLKVLKVDEIKKQDNRITVNAVATSRVAKQWQFDSVSGKVTFVIESGKIAKAVFGLRMAIPFEGW